MRRPASLFALLFFLATPVAAQQPAWSGPYLTATSNEGSLVLIATGDPSPGAILTYGRIDNHVRRIETVLEVDCPAGRYRSGAMQIYETDAAGARGALLIDGPGLTWRPFGAQDVIARDYFCSGLAGDDVHRTIQPAFSAWINRYGG